MRIRGSHITVVVLAIIVGLVALVLLRDRAITGDGIETAVDDARVPAVTEDPDNVPIIELDTYNVHLGTVANTGFTTHEVKIFNRGKADLQIKDIQTTCACTLGWVEKQYNPIPPGGEGILSIRIDPRRIPGFNSRKTLTIQSSDAIHPNVQLQVEVDVEPEYELIPPEIDMGQMVKGDGSTGTMVLRQLRDEPIVITEVKESIPEQMPQEDLAIEFSFELLPEDQWLRPGKEEYLITARQADLCPGGPFERRFQIHSNIDRAMQYIAVRGSVITPYAIDMGARGFVLLGAGQQGSTPEGRIVVTGESDIQIASLTVDTSRLNVDVPDNDPAKSVTINVRVAPDAVPGQLFEFVYFTIRMNGQDYRERVPVRGIVS